MTMDFEDRLALAAELEAPFIKAFNEMCNTHEIVKFGIESTPLRTRHDHIRDSEDKTARFIRYLPDSGVVRLRTANKRGPIASLLEFKMSDELVRYDSMLSRIRNAHRTRNQGQPPISNKQDIFGIEKASLGVYQQLASIGINVIIVAFQRQRTIDSDRLRAEYAQSIVTCQEHTPDPERRRSGSGTPLANVHFGAFRSVQEFFVHEFQIPLNVIENVVKAVYSLPSSKKQ